ncbi:MAG: hypothetical protein Q4D14_07505 [Bacteroidales bacterium]|nr:hypothetical protein [Bacteroidales bacterium]
MRKILGIILIIASLTIYNQVWLGGVASEKAETAMSECAGNMAEWSAPDAMSHPLMGVVSLGFDLDSQIAEIQYGASESPSLQLQRNKQRRELHHQRVVSFTTLQKVWHQVVCRHELLPYDTPTPALFYVFALRRILC